MQRLDGVRTVRAMPVTSRNRLAANALEVPAARTIVTDEHGPEVIAALNRVGVDVRLSGAAPLTGTVAVSGVQALLNQGTVQVGIDIGELARCPVDRIVADGCDSS